MLSKCKLIGLPQNNILSSPKRSIVCLSSCSSSYETSLTQIIQLLCKYTITKGFQRSFDHTNKYFLPDLCLKIQTVFRINTPKKNCTRRGASLKVKINATAFIQIIKINKQNWINIIRGIFLNRWSQHYILYPQSTTVTSYDVE